ncbi:hypothetical protein P153DRAFT_373082 [Dothidotthia symphoricarpi CBS 119687]|uniref:Rhodopsin domain-containing protein n=1 Tax=Dothidotthia symphoricarpi CBS 119687 TaxID=1392245 RepID=A0A6A6APL3_9PLEO|nr:uncharacterized protein P153DRAFT_373082 [Dothidotthia symphoricarpi CBS 119687]KAF2133476.1 hypothetical protein P153DRAFT_373082 [Dothidotthia symphoricarpi CBS 119687]
MYTGYRSKDVPYNAIDMVSAMKLQYALSATYSPCINIIKASFLWSLYKLRSHNPWVKRSIISLQVINTIHMIVVTVIGAIPCLPVAKKWYPELPGGCWDPLLYVKSNISIVIVTDFLVLCIPTWMIWDLQMPLKRKVVTIAFLSFGIVVIAVGIARLLWLLDAFTGKTDSYSITSAYSAVESSVAIMGTSGPTIKYILSRCIPWLRPSWERAGSNKPSGYAYGNHSNAEASRHHRNMHGNMTEYGDLDDVSAHNEDFEMKNGAGWRFDSDAHSDEQRITADTPGIMKSVEWTVQSREDPHITPVAPVDRNTAGHPAASPTHIV